MWPDYWPKHVGEHIINKNASLYRHICWVLYILQKCFAVREYDVHAVLFTVRAALHGSYSYLMLRDCRRCLRQICYSKLMLCLLFNCLRVKNKPKKVAVAVTGFDACLGGVHFVYEPRF